MHRFPTAVLLLILGAMLPAPAQEYERGPARSPHGRLAAPCANCHSSTSWSPLRGVLEFNHNSQTRFALRGAHESVTCRLCHTSLVFQNTGSSCSNCHADIHRRQFGGTCENCHTPQGWRVAVQSIRAHQNRFPLLGAHTTATCESCHQGAATAGFTGRSTECASCHLKNYQEARPLNHAAANLPLTCNLCHGMDNFTRARFDHARFTSFPLEAAHANVDCVRCHAGGSFNATSQECFSCHSAEFTAARPVDHVKAGFPKTCLTCHNGAAWTGARFDHAAMTRFPLAGAHQQVNCASCHANSIYAGTRQDCYGCHAGNYAATKNPDHTRGAFPTNCADCHTTAGWPGARFDHALARFQLTGAHVQAACTQCHAGGQYTGTNSLCAGCHLADFNRAANPNHVTAGFTQECASCHTTAGWPGVSFDHASKTRFTLTGAHMQVSCNKCHVGDRFAGVDSQCVGCHLGDYQKAANPNHVTAGFPQDCTTCHTTARWTGGAFDHGKTKFMLTGAHAQVVCAQCHVGGKFAGTTTDCIGCHLATFQGTTSPNHVAAGFSQDCTTCHTTARWTGAAFDHAARTRFALTGAHVQVACAQCHVGGKFAGTATDCVGCHLGTFQRTTSPNHVTAGFPQDCTTCHTTARWTGGAFDHTARTRFTLTGAHVQVACAQCHVGGNFAGTSTDCVGCHLATFQRTTSPNHVTAGFPQNCTTCHTTARWTGGAFDHTARTRFTLTGAHVQVACAQCHVGGNFAGTSTDCVGCHLATFQRTTNPNHVNAGFPQTCASCHTTSRWAGANFDHAARTRFTLTGAHVQVACAQCHVGGRFAGTPTDCVGCHLATFQRTTNPNHVTAGFPQTCTTCHTTARWTGATFDHTARTRFTLTGAHVQVACALCHVGGRFAGTPTDCVGCHLTTFQRTTNPNHVTAGFPQTCTTCHTTTGWRPSTFSHASTRFALTGAHVQVACAQCHVGGRFAGTPTDCVGCHLATFQGTTNPNHVSAGFPQTCTTCHTTTGWRPSTFSHASTRFALTGAHVQVACALCHVGGRYAGTPTECAGCHLTTFQRTTNPNHVAAGFPQTCASCHTTARWTGATFDHNARTRFPLTGAHVQVACALCHVGGRYAGTPTDCVGCHLATFQRTTNPNHVSAGFPQTCTTCHTTTAWRPSTFSHASTRFALTGAHVQVACAQCHVGGRFAGTPANCVGCHLTTFQGTTNPNHVAAGFPQDCSLCHSTTNWAGATFNHSTTRFPLAGRHTSVACSACHAGGVYAGLASTCVSCHIANYQRTTNPNHTTSGFPQQCEVCHTPTGWTPASFNHGTTRFPLTGRHTSVACASCHVGGRYAGTPTDCYSCHRTLYTSVTNPNHVAAGFPTTCQTCHTTSGWSGATFNHTWFPITSGAHQGRACAECHTNPSNYQVFTCLTCHTRTSTDSRHSGRTGYVYNSANCYSCHPNGRG